MWSLSLLMSECSLSGRGQGPVSNFYIVDLENFATACRRYTGDIHNSSVVGLFMTPMRQWKRVGCAMVECTCLLHIASKWTSNFLTSICSGLVVQVVSALLRGNWQDFNWHDASRGLGDSWAFCLQLVPVTGSPCFHYYWTGLYEVAFTILIFIIHHHHHHYHFICPIIQQYAHLREYDSRRAGQQGPIRTLTAALKTFNKNSHWVHILSHK